VAAEKGYYAEEGLAVDLEPLPGGADLVALTASGQLQAAAAGAGPAFWNGLALGLPLVVVAPGHFEGSPVATPLMISRKVCESGAVESVADSRQDVSVNARVPPSTGSPRPSRPAASPSMTHAPDDPLPDAVFALEAGAVDAAMVGEPLATKAEQDGIAVRLADDFLVRT
jgi:NitT/TauT family transport system substrate-binding protein